MLIQNSFSQNPFYITIDKASGLPSNSVYDIFQSSKGFMWFATGKGLTRYDGNTFKTYTSDLQTSKSGSNIVEDRYGRIWYCNFDGFLYYIENEELKSLNQTNSAGYFRFGIINEELFLIQNKSIWVYDLKTLIVKKRISIDDNFKTSYATLQNFYVLGDNLYVFSSAKNYKKIELPSSFSDDMKTPILSYWGNQLNINSKYSAIFYTFSDGIFTKYSITSKSKFVQNIAISDHTMWICMPNGILNYDLQTNKIKPFFSEFNVSYVFKDKNQNYWISTLNKGVLFLEDFENSFIELPIKPLTLSKGNDVVYIGTERDLIYKLDIQKFKYYPIHETHNNHAISQIYSDTLNDKLYFNSYKFNILNKDNSLNNTIVLAVKDINRIDHKYLSFAASGVNGIFCMDTNQKSTWDHVFEKNIINSFSGFNQSRLLSNANGKSTAYNPKNNTIYYATNNGCMAVTEKGKTFEIKHHAKSLYLVKIESLQNYIIGLSTNEILYKINADNEVSLLDLPLNIRNEKWNRFRVFGQYMYLFTSNSIFEYDYLSKKVVKILATSNNFEATDVVLNNNQLFFATSKGIVVKNRNEIGEYPQPKLMINEVHVNGDYKNNLDLNHLKSSENDIVINFSTLTFIPNENYETLYKINHSDWKRLDINVKKLIFSSLAPGKYEIQIAINYNNQIIDKQKIMFQISKPFWLSNFFIFFANVFLVFIFYSLYKFQIKKIEEQNKINFEKNELEKSLNLSTLKAIKSQMNPHFFYNALNTIQSYILANDKKQAVNYLSKFSSLTRNILELTEKENVSIAEEITTLNLYLDIEKARFDADFDFEIIANFDDTENEKIPAMLLQPYVENAVKHGLLHKSGLKKLIINFNMTNQTIVVTIDDNGIGRKKSSELNAIKNKNHKSFATTALQNRINLLNQNKTNQISIEIIDKQNSIQMSLGTTVVIKIPINFST